MTELPGGWVEAKFGDLGAWSSGGTPSRRVPSYFGGTIPWVKTGDLKHGFLESVEEFITPEGLKNSAAKLFPKGSLLVAMYGATIGQTGVLTFDAATNQACAALLSSGATSELIPYVWKYLIAIQQELKAVGQGGAQPNISQEILKVQPIPVAPLPEQRRIVAKIDSLSSKSKRARDRLEHLPRLVEKYKQAVLVAAFRGDLSRAVRVDFRTVAFREVVESTFYGPRIAKEAYVERGTPTLRTTDIGDWGKITLKEPPQVAVTKSEFGKWGFLDGDLMVTRTGATIGKCATYEASMGPALPSAYLIRVRLKLDIVDPRYAVLFLLSPIGQQQLLDGRTAVAQPNINAPAITSTSFPLCSIDHQREIVSRIDAAFTWIDRLAAESTSARKLIERLDQTILTKAFAGELVPQDPADEPASVLLERIKTERNAEPKAKKLRSGGRV